MSAKGWKLFLLGKKKSFILRLWPAYIVGIKMFFLGETTMIVNILFIRHQKKKSWQPCESL